MVEPENRTSGRAYLAKDQLSCGRHYVVTKHVADLHLAILVQLYNLGGRADGLIGCCQTNSNSSPFTV